jgi:VanZ family protein
MFSHAPQPTTYSAMIITSRLLSAVLIVLLFTVGNMPAAGQQFPGTSHWVAHLGSYAVIAFTFGMGWNRLAAAYVAVIIGLVGFAHELTEIVFHGHPLETYDVLVNFCGALMGSAALALYRKYAR